MRGSIMLFRGKQEKRRRNAGLGLMDEDSRMGSLGGGASIARKMSRKRWNFKPFGWRCLRREKVKNCAGILSCQSCSSRGREGKGKRNAGLLLMDVPGQGEQFGK